jgi:hypothetical protein
MASRLRVNLPPTWSDQSGEYPEGPPTYIRLASANPGALQISWASYTRAGPPPPITDEGLIQLATRLATSSGERVVSQKNGDSNWGRFGCVVAITPQQRLQVWVINNGRDKILVTHTGPNPPDEAELSEADQIVMDIGVTEADEPAKKPSIWDRLRGGR